jgi:CheY-like chemotaxis protein
MSATASTILVVEDDDIVRMLIVDVLEELEYQVLEADGGDNALRQLENPDQPIHLLMTDYGLPGITGIELAGKALELRPELRVLVASGFGEHLDIPAHAFTLAKPFSIDALRDKVKEILG